MGDLADTNDYENLVYVQYLLREDYEANIREENRDSG